MKTSKTVLYVQGKNKEHSSLKLGLEPTGNGTWFNLAPNVLKFMFDKVEIGDKVEVSIPIGDDKAVIQFMTIVEKSVAAQSRHDSYPSKQEQKIIDEWSREKSILWQSCMKIAVEVEKGYMCGDPSPSRQETIKNIIVMTDALYEASTRKYNNLPPIPE